MAGAHRGWAGRSYKKEILGKSVERLKKPAFKK